MLLTAICNFSDALAFLNPWCGMTSRDSLSQQVRKPGISVIPVSQMIPLNPARLAHLWVDFWVIGNIITVNFTFLESFSHLWSQGFTFHPSSNHHHYHHIIITTSLLSSNHHHYHHIIITTSLLSSNHYHLTITSSSPVSKDHISHYISRKTLHQLKGSQATERKRKRCSTMKQSRSAIHFTLT